MARAGAGAAFVGVGARPLVVKAGGDVSTEIGEAVRVGVPLGACHLFDADGVAFGRREEE